MDYRILVVRMLPDTGGSRLPSPVPSSTFPFIFLPLPFPSLPLEVVPLNTARGLESVVSSLSGVCGGTPAQIDLVHFSLKKLTAGGTSFTNFPENHLLRERLV